jgi:hypothetical protein
MTEHFGNPDFWIALAVGVVSSGILILWLYRGGRKPLQKVDGEGDAHRDASPDQRRD